MIPKARKVLSRMHEDSLSQVASSNQLHHFISLGKYKNEAIAVGDWNHHQEEILSNDVWVELGPYPFAKEYIYAFSTVTFRDEMYIFGKAEYSCRYKELAKIHFFI